jgi:anti-sigma B factor antagonist
LAIVIRLERRPLVSTLRALVTAGESGPVIALAGETDVTTVAELTEVVDAQLASGAAHLTVDARHLTFADSTSIRVLVLAARTLRERGGELVLRHPQEQLTRMLEIMGADQVIAITPRARPE